MTKGYAKSQYEFYKQQWKTFKWLYEVALMEHNTIRTPYPTELENQYDSCTNTMRYWFNIEINTPE